MAKKIELEKTPDPKPIKKDDEIAAALKASHAADVLALAGIDEEIKTAQDARKLYIQQASKAFELKNKEMAEAIAMIQVRKIELTNRVAKNKEILGEE